MLSGAAVPSGLVCIWGGTWKKAQSGCGFGFPFASISFSSVQYDSGGGYEGGSGYPDGRVTRSWRAGRMGIGRPFGVKSRTPRFSHAGGIGSVDAAAESHRRALVCTVRRRRVMVAEVELGGGVEVEC